MALTQQQINENVAYLQNKGASQDEISSYMQEVSPVSRRIEEREPGIPSKIIDFLGGGEEGRQRFEAQREEAIARRQAREGLPRQLLGESGDILRGAAIQTAKAAPLLVGGPAIGAARAVGAVPRALQVGKEALRLGGVTGVARTAEEALEGAELPEAARIGTRAGITTGALIGGIPAAAKTAKVAKGLIKGAIETGLRVKPWALNVLKKNPEIITKTQKPISEVGHDIDEALSGLNQFAQKQYNKRIDRLKIPKGKSVDTTEIRRLIGKIGIPGEELAGTISSQTRKQLVKIRPGAIEDMIEGRKIGFHEAKKINSMLANAIDDGVSAGIGSGAIGKLQSLKTSLMDSMGGVAKGIKVANKNYAKETDLYRKMTKKVGDPFGRETTLRQLGEQLSGVAKKRTELAKELGKLNRFRGKGKPDILKQLRDSTVAEEFANRPQLGTFGTVARSALGGVMGQQLAGVPGMVAGLTAAQALGQPQTMQQIIRGLGAVERARIPKAVPAAARQIARIGAIRAGQRNQAKRRNDGTVSPTRMAQIKSERNLP